MDLQRALSRPPLGLEQTHLLSFSNREKPVLVLVGSCCWNHVVFENFFSFSQISDSNLRLRFLPFASLKPNNFEIEIQNKIKSVIEIFDSLKFQTQI